jgi:hypothetical protein
MYSGLFLEMLSQQSIAERIADLDRRCLISDPIEVRPAAHNPRAKALRLWCTRTLNVFFRHVPHARHGANA